MRARSYKRPFRNKYKTQKSYKNLQAIGCYVKERIPFNILYVLAVFAVFGTTVALGAPEFIYDKFSSLMKLRTVEFKEIGASNVSQVVPQGYLRKVAALQTGEELLKIDLNHLEKRLMSIPWIYAVRIRKSLPSTVTVEYETENVRAIVMKNKTPWLISSKGRELAPLTTLNEQYSDLTKAETTETTVATHMVSAIRKQAAAYDLPVLIAAKKADVEILLSWLEKLETEVGSDLITVHQLESTNWGGVKSLVDIVGTDGRAVKVTLIGWPELSKTTTLRLAKVLNALHNKNISPRTIDLRPGKKIIVSQAEGS